MAWKLNPFTGALDYYEPAAAVAAHAATHVTGGGDTVADAIAAGNAGLMSGADKTKLDGIAAGAQPGTVTSVTGTAPVASSGGTTPAISIPAATNLVAGHATAAHITAIEANTAKNTNVPTALSMGTIGVATIAITSDGGADDVTLPTATNAAAGVASAAQITQLEANTSRYIQIRLLDKDTSHTVVAGIGGEFRLKVAMTVLDVGAYFDTAGTTSVTTIDINEGGVSILSTKITVDATEKTSETAATPPVISDAVIAADAIITFDIDGIASGTAGKGLVIWLEVTIP